MTVPLYLPPAHTPPDPDFRETLQGGHALIIEHVPGHAVVVQYGDAEFWISCENGEQILRPVRPDRSLTGGVEEMLDCAPTEAAQLPAHCQCGAQLGLITRATLDPDLEAVLSTWERHTMIDVAAGR